MPDYIPTNWTPPGGIPPEGHIAHDWAVAWARAAMDLKFMRDSTSWLLELIGITDKNSTDWYHSVPREPVGDYGKGLPWIEGVTCIACLTKTPHFTHWFPGCTCAAANEGTSHATHCDLYRAVFHYIPDHDKVDDG